MKFLTLLFVITLSFAENIDLIRFKTADSEDSILLKGKSENCVITFYSFAAADIDLEKTTCLNMKNSKKINIFCTKNKEICKTETEITYFRSTGKKFPHKRPAKIPFIGVGIFNFDGGTGTQECVKINQNGQISFGNIPSLAISESEVCRMRKEKKRKWNDNNSLYWVDKYAVCKIENGHTGLCTSLEITDINTTDTLLD